MEAFDNSMGYGQANNEGEFSIDINFVKHNKNNKEVPRGIGFISFAWKDKVKKQN